MFRRALFFRCAILQYSKLWLLTFFKEEYWNNDKLLILILLLLYFRWHIFQFKVSRTKAGTGVGFIFVHISGGGLVSINWKKKSAVILQAKTNVYNFCFMSPPHPLSTTSMYLLVSAEYKVISIIYSVAALQNIYIFQVEF